MKAKTKATLKKDGTSEVQKPATVLKFDREKAEEQVTKLINSQPPLLAASGKEGIILICATTTQTLPAIVRFHHRFLFGGIGSQTDLINLRIAIANTAAWQGYVEYDSCDVSAIGLAKIPSNEIEERLKSPKTDGILRSAIVIAEIASDQINDKVVLVNQLGEVMNFSAQSWAILPQQVFNAENFMQEWHKNAFRYDPDDDFEKILDKYISLYESWSSFRGSKIEATEIEVGMLYREDCVNDKWEEAFTRARNHLTRNQRTAKNPKKI